MLKKLLIIQLLLLCILLLNAEWIDLQSNQNLFNSTKGNYQETEIDFTLDGYEIEISRNNTIDYSKISYKNEGETVLEGKPHLPQFTRLIIIPNHGTPEIEVMNNNSQTVENINILPHQGFISESSRAEESFKIDHKFYASNSCYPSKSVAIGVPIIMRDYRVVPVTFSPFCYNPSKKELEIYTNLSVRISTSGSAGENCKTSNSKKSRMFENMYKTFINYTPNYRIEDFQQPSYLIISPDDEVLLEMTNQLIEWKTQKGFIVNFADTDETGTSSNSIKNYIQNAYDNWENPPEFVCIIGDVGGSYSIPTSYYNSGEGDQFYALLEGNDIVADLAIGRLSFRTLSDYQTIINKIKNYEKEPYMQETDWYEKA
ncbi:MAG: C25 family peptidase propeptide domain-containing protein, partial [Candidatus Cloacimonadota bacterium]|nr:C25 family peptidase propeptide domain-containing protein [Candidatus Cloacimonadota bacterium]